MSFSRGRVRGVICKLSSSNCGMRIQLQDVWPSNYNKIRCIGSQSAHCNLTDKVSYCHSHTKHIHTQFFSDCKTALKTEGTHASKRTAVPDNGSDSGKEKVLSAEEKSVFYRVTFRLPLFQHIGEGDICHFMSSMQLRYQGKWVVREMM
ncbi:hypothetical protein Tco_0329246 [Tanacetum coccineum]